MPGGSTPDPPLRIGVLGGVPAALGGHGLELQLERTLAGLRELGHGVTRVHDAQRGATWDVVHAFGSEGDVQHVLAHWTRSRAPLVVTPVLVVSPGRAELALRLAARWPAPATHAALRVRALRGADLLLAGTEYEQRVLRGLLGRSARIEIVPNGADPMVPDAPGELEPGYALLLGAVSSRKGQDEVVRALAGSMPVVVAGGHSEGAEHRLRWEAAVAETGARWLGHVESRTRIARLLADAAALVHMAREEVQSLAVLEALAAGTPVVLSDIPSHRELAQAYPGWVSIAGTAAELPELVRRIRSEPRPATPPAVPTWSDVAARTAAAYRRLLAR